MAVFLTALIATIVDFTLLNGAVGYIALSTGVIVLALFIALKAEGRGYSITKINNELEMEKIEKELAEHQEELDRQKKTEEKGGSASDKAQSAPEEKKR